VVAFTATAGRISTEGILAGEQDPGELIRVMSHAAITTRTVQDAAIVLDTLAGTDVTHAVTLERQLRAGVGTNFQADDDVRAHFNAAVEVFRQRGDTLTVVPVPSFDLRQGVADVYRDRQRIGERAFKDIDVILLPTLATAVPTVQAASADPAEGLSAQNTVSANYFGLPAVTVPCGFDARGLPLGLQILGRPNDEATVLQAAYLYQREAGGYRPPGLSIG
jgi:aspartyl-tRNA(Asn)/glutamyl-tRNA(Gln) amidotransferase subunit A